MPVDGLVLQLVSGLFITFMSSQAKILSGHGFDLFQIVFCRSIILLNFAIYLSWKENASPLRSEKKWILAIRGVFGFLTITSIYAAISVMNLADATTFLMVAPCLTSVLAPLLLNQDFNKAGFIAIPVAFSGVVLVTQPPMLFGSNGKSLTAFQLLVGMTQAISGACAKLSVGYLSSIDCPTAHIILSMAVVSTFGSSILLLILPNQTFHMPHSFVDLFFLVGIGICASIVQATGTLALKRANIVAVMTVSYLGIIWSVIADYIIFRQVANLLSILGAALVVFSNIGLIVYEYQRKHLSSSRQGLNQEMKPILSNSTT